MTDLQGAFASFKTDPFDPDPMNRFHSISDPAEAMAIIRHMIAGERFPEVTLWRLHSYCENAVVYGRILERNERAKRATIVPQTEP